MRPMGTPATPFCGLSNRAPLSRRSLIGAAGAAVLSGCGANNGNDEDPQTWSLNYRLSVRGFAGGQPREGSGVYRTVYRRVPESALNQTEAFYSEAWGEALAIDMGTGLLLGLLDSVSGVSRSHRFSPLDPRLVIQVLPESERTSEAYHDGTVFSRARELRGEISLPPESWPLLAHFADRDDIASVSFVPWPGRQYDLSPGVPSRALSSIFGADARLDQVTIEIVDDAPSSGIEQLLPWTNTMNGAGGRFTQRRGAPFHENLIQRNFMMRGESR